MQPINILRQHITELKAKYPIAKLGIFGSYSRGEQTPQSDVDIIVQFTEPVGMTFIDLSFELENLLQIKVDLVSLNALKPRYFQAIQADIIYV